MGVRLPDTVKMAALTEHARHKGPHLPVRHDEREGDLLGNKVASRKEMPVPVDMGRLKDVQDWG